MSPAELPPDAPTKVGGRVLVAMSGGVDSSVAAALLRDQGHEVIGVTLHLWDYPDDGSVRGRCCAPEDIHDARRVADALGIPHYAFDRRELFEREVVEPFVESYLSGVTPSPCVRCNRGIKMRELLRLADRLDADAVATGHFARIRQIDGVPRLFRGFDEQKDQSYFLHMLSPESLARLRFPLGELTKSEVRQYALSHDLPGATKGESQELCFVPTGRYDEFVAERGGQRLQPGAILDDEGTEVGRHPGVHAFTIGQRRNLGVSAGRRLYVVGLDADSGSVRLGSKEQLLSSAAELDDVALADDVALPRRCQARVRYRGKPVAAEISRTTEPAADGMMGVRVTFDQPVQAVVPGQVAVFYDGERVLGGGTIRSARPAAEPETRQEKVEAN